jgi:hypothetical protein
MRNGKMAKIIILFSMFNSLSKAANADSISYCGLLSYDAI